MSIVVGFVDNSPNKVYDGTTRLPLQLFDMYLMVRRNDLEQNGKEMEARRLTTGWNLMKDLLPVLAPSDLDNFPRMPEVHMALGLIGSLVDMVIIDFEIRGKKVKVIPVKDVDCKYCFARNICLNAHKKKKIEKASHLDFNWDKPEDEGESESGVSDFEMCVEWDE